MKSACVRGILIFLCYFAHTNAGNDLNNASLTFIIVDMKYSDSRKVQICEIQHGMCSAFKGETFAYGKSRIVSNFLALLDNYYPKCWVQNQVIADVSLRKEFKKYKTWTNVSYFNHLHKDRTFVKKGTAPVYDPSSLSSFHGFLYMDLAHSGETREYFRHQFPGIMIIDNETYQFWHNKLAWSELFLNHPVLEQYKPRWAAYEKKYRPELVQNIIADIPGDRFVIKPLTKSRGRGVIIVDQQDLDATLRYILKETGQKPAGYDLSYDEWFDDESSDFLIEAFAASDPVAVEHLQDKVYSPTMRLGFLIIHEKSVTEVICLGGYYSLPQKSLFEEGTLNEKYKSYCQLPYYCQADPTVMQKATLQLQDVLKIAYQRMLSTSSSLK